MKYVPNTKPDKPTSIEQYNTSVIVSTLGTERNPFILFGR